jgi:hypothetical protein
MILCGDNERLTIFIVGPVRLSAILLGFNRVVDETDTIGFGAGDRSSMLTPTQVPDVDRSTRPLALVSPLFSVVGCDGLSFDLPLGGRGILVCGWDYTAMVCGLSGLANVLDSVFVEFVKFVKTALSADLLVDSFEELPPGWEEFGNRPIYSLGGGDEFMLA